MARREIDTSIGIGAPPAAVWAILTDFAAMADWNPLIRSIEGTPAVGRRLKVTIQPQGKAPMRFAPTVTRADPGRELAWLGRVGLPGLFDGAHHFRLEPDGRGGTHFIHGEVFTGLLVGLVMGGAMLDGTRAGFTAMNEALKARAESG